MKEWKRCMAAVLSFVIFMTSVNFSEAAGKFDQKYHIWTACEGEILTEYYELGAKATELMQNKAVRAGNRYTLFTPYDNETKGKKDLIAVDYINRTIYAKSLISGGHTWMPVTAVVSGADTEEQIILNSGIYRYDNNEYNASGAFTYSENSYKVTINYQLSMTIAAEEQSRILEIPVVLAQTAKNMETSFKGCYSYLKRLSDMVPFLERLLTMELEKTEMVLQEETGERAPVITKEPALDPEAHADEIKMIRNLVSDYETNQGLKLYQLNEDYRKTSGAQIISYTKAHGKEILEESQKLYEAAQLLKDSQRIGVILQKLQTEDPDLYAELKYFKTTLSSLLGTAYRPGGLRELQKEANWTILDESVSARIFETTYTESDFAALENIVAGLAGKSYSVPQIQGETIPAAEMTASCEITTHSLQVTLKASAVTDQVEDDTVLELAPYETTLILLERTTEQEITEALEKCGIEAKALSEWNAQSSNYQINTGNYERKETKLPKELLKDESIEITYTPKYYKVDTDYRENLKVPYGYQMEFPVSKEEEISYEYIIENAQGTKVSCNEGVTYRVTQSVSISRIQGAEKTEYRLYDILVSDVQYSMSEEAKQILANAAVESPSLKIRVPDGNAVGEVVFEDGVYCLTAQDVSSGILGMVWEPYMAYVMNGENLVESVRFEDHTAAWTNADFTHVKADYRLKISKVKDGIFNRDLDEVEDVLYALNLPYELVTETVKQNQLLSGSQPNSVKSLYGQLESLKMFMGQAILGVIGSSMKTTAGKDAVIQLSGSENQIIKGTQGQKLGYGGWDSAKDQLAIYTYMGQCEESDWSLAAYYKNGSYEKLAKQCGILAKCLDAIVKDPGIDTLLETYNAADKKQKMKELVPHLETLSRELKGPHKALKVNSEEFPSLIELLITMEGKVSAVDTSDGVYAYSSIRKNGEKSGSLTISVKAGSKAAKTKEISYLLENGQHILTEEEAAQIEADLLELELSAGLTEEEKTYYDVIATSVPTAGSIVGKNETVSRTYLPKEYTVTIAGRKDYQAVFKYKSDYVIELPAYSENPEEINYYCYKIKDESKRVYNGTTGYYTFTKEDLTELFVDQHYQITCEVLQILSDWDPLPTVKTSDKLIRGSHFDFENKLLFLDASPEGLSITQFEKYVSFETGAGAEVTYEIFNSNRNAEKYNILANGTTIECHSLDQQGKDKVTEYTIIMMGDLNKDGLINKTDMELLVSNYLKTASSEEELQDSADKLAADMNGNGSYLDSNDALQIVKKYKKWNSTGENAYLSVL